MHGGKPFFHRSVQETNMFAIVVKMSSDLLNIDKDNILVYDSTIYLHIHLLYVGDTKKYRHV